MSNAQNNGNHEYDYKKILPKSMHRLYEIVGHDKFEQILEEYGGNDLYLIKKETFHKAIRDRNIYDEYLQNQDYNALVIKYNLSITSVRRITKECARKEQEENEE